MKSIRQRLLHLLIGAAAAAAFLVTTSALIPETAPPASAQPCVDGVIPWNPYIVNCNLPPRGPRIRGAAPDAGAIIACRDKPGCLAWYVNPPF